MVRQAVKSSAVARQMQDRTHKGGAVLWFLRKHAPMPVPYSDYLTEDDPTVASSNRGSSGERRRSKDAAKRASSVETAKPKPKAVAGSQRKFLHGTLQVIGTELDKQIDEDDDAFGHMPHPQGSRMGGDNQSAAWEAREHLRKRYASHTISELDQLEAAVEEKEREVAALKKQVEQMTRFLAATRAAASNRRLREARNESGEANTNKAAICAGALALLQKKKKTLLQSAGAAVWDVDEAPATGRENVIEEWQHSIMQQSEMALRMRAHVDEQKKILEQQTSYRKAQETALFSTQVASLKLRAEAHQAEARVQRLANELKRVYQALPETIQQKVGPDMAVARKKQRDHDITSLREKHQVEFFKFMDPDKIHVESEISQRKISEHEEDTNLAHQVLERGRWFAESSVQHTKAAQTALNALHDRWARFVAAGYAAGELTVKDELGQRSDDADCVMQRATLSVTALTSLIDMLHTGSASLHENIAQLEDSEVKGSGRAGRITMNLQSKDGMVSSLSVAREEVPPFSRSDTVASLPAEPATPNPVTPPKPAEPASLNKPAEPASLNTREDDEAMDAFDVLRDLGIVR